MIGSQCSIFAIYLGKLSSDKMSSKLFDHSHKDHSGKGCQPEILNTLAHAIKSWKTSDQGSPSKVVKSEEGDAITRTIEKRIIHGSTRAIPVGCEAAGGGLAYPKESKFVFHYQIRKLDDDRTVLDDTRKYGKTMEVYSGKEFQLDVSSYCILLFTAKRRINFACLLVCSHFPSIVIV